MVRFVVSGSQPMIVASGNLSNLEFYCIKKSLFWAKKRQPCEFCEKESLATKILTNINFVDSQPG